MAHRAAPSEGRAISFIDCEWASFPANAIVRITAKKYIGAISLFCTENVSAAILLR